MFPAQWSAENANSDRVGYVTLEKSDVYAATARGAYDLAGVGELMQVSLINSEPTEMMLIIRRSLLVRRLPTSETCERLSICLGRFSSTWSS